MKFIRYILLCNLLAFIACNDADYKTIDNSAFINEWQRASRRRC